MMNTLLFAGLLGSATAFPHLAKRDPLADFDFSQLSSGYTEERAKRQAFGINVGFDEKAQYISTSGEYAFVPPGPDDIRGPCPGLNALANHGYLPHNGVANIQQFIDSTYKVFGMGLDLAGFLAIYGAVFDGDLVSWSIGGPPPADLLSPLEGLGLLGRPQGLSGSHNKYESDVSPTRGDLFISENAFEVRMELFKELYSYQATETEETSDYNLGVMQNHRVKRFQNSIETNPYFFNGPFSGVLVQPAAYTFIFRFMANRSAEYPEGRLSQSVLKSFFSITGDTPDSFVYTPGFERIPDNWYRRAYGDEYTIPFFLLDVLAEAVSNPQFLDIGGNTGAVNSFTGLDLQNLTGGVYNTKNLLEGNNLQCFTFQLLNQAAPDLLEGLLQNVGKALGLLQNQVTTILTGLGCPQISDKTYDQYKSQLGQFPGYTQLKSNGYY